MLMTPVWDKRVMFLLQHPQKVKCVAAEQRNKVVEGKDASGERWGMKVCHQWGGEHGGIRRQFLLTDTCGCWYPLGCFSPLNPLCSWWWWGVSGIHSPLLGSASFHLLLLLSFFRTNRIYPVISFLHQPSQTGARHESLMWSAPTWWFSGPARVWPPASTPAEVEGGNKSAPGIVSPNKCHVFFCPWVEMRLHFLGGVVVVPHPHLELSSTQRWIRVFVCSLLPKNI